MEIIETSDRKDWFDVGLQTYMSGELQYSTQTVKFTSDWNGLDLIKGGASFTVSDMCPYFPLIVDGIIRHLCASNSRYGCKRIQANAYLLTIS